jgi:hypothetical protein
VEEVVSDDVQVGDTVRTSHGWGRVTKLVPGERGPIALIACEAGDEHAGPATLLRKDAPQAGSDASCGPLAAAVSPSDGARVGGKEGSEARTGAQGHARRCDGESYLSWDRDEDGVWHVRMECNDAKGRDCGWHFPFSDDDGVTDQEFRIIHDQHLIYSEIVASDEAARSER